MPLVVVVFNKKGGVGKTTLADGLADVLESRGRKVAFISVDPQIGARHATGEGAPDPSADYVVVDTPGAITESTRDLLPTADVVIVPTIPSTANVASTQESLAMVHRDAPDALVLTVINSRRRTSSDNAFVSQVEEGMLGDAGIVFCVPERTAFRDAERWRQPITTVSPSAAAPIEAMADVIELMESGEPWSELIARAVSSNWAVHAGTMDAMDEGDDE